MSSNHKLVWDKETVVTEESRNSDDCGNAGLLPDPTVEPSAQPQPPDKACRRCQQNGLDCIVDHTTLGRPAQKRKGVAQATSDQTASDSGHGPEPVNDDSTFVDETAERDLEDFLMAHPDGDRSHIGEIKNMKPSKMELSTSLLSPFHLLAALLERDKHFASNVVPEKPPASSILELVDEDLAGVLDQFLVWHRLIYPDIPYLTVLRKQVADMHVYYPNRDSRLFLLNLLCDLAIDAPSPALAQHRHLQGKIRAMLYHSGQMLLYSLARSGETMLALELASQYRPLVLTASQMAAGQAVKGFPQVQTALSSSLTLTYCRFLFMSVQAAIDLGYHKAGPRLLDAMQDPGRKEELPRLMHHCLHWIRLCCAQTAITPTWPDHIIHLQEMNEDAERCLEALQTAAMLNLIPASVLLAYNCASSSAKSLASTREAFQKWRDLGQLGDIILTHKAFNDAEEEALNGALGQLHGAITADTSHAILQQAELERHMNQINVAGATLFFAIMHGAHAASNQKGIRLDQAVEVSEKIIEQLTLHDESDPDRPAPRRFLETYGRDRADQLEKALSTFINMSDTLSLSGVPYVNTSRNTVAALLAVCKDIVESNAARLKGWNGLHERVDVQMILFVETARRLEGMSHSAGTREALHRGCVLTAGAKLIRSLHRILQDFKKTLMARQRQSASGGSSSKPSATPPTVTPESDVSAPLAPAQTGSSAGTTESSWESIITDDLFVDWDNWPQFDAMDFSDLFGDDFDWTQL